MKHDMTCDIHQYFVSFHNENREEFKSNLPKDISRFHLDNDIKIVGQFDIYSFFLIETNPIGFSFLKSLPYVKDIRENIDVSKI